MFNLSLSLLLILQKLFSQIYVPTNPKGAERLPPGIVVSETDLYLRRLWGEPSEVGYCFYHFSVHLKNAVLILFLLIIPFMSII